MKKLLLLGVTTILMAGCSWAPDWAPRVSGSNSGVSPSQAAAIEKQVRERADYWQRADRVSAEHMVGPQAQHTLHSDISRCVAEVREMVRLGSIRQAQPPKGVPMDPELKSGWGPVTRNGPLYMEYTPYQDFDSCMMTKGWARVDFVRPVVADQAAHNYNGTILGMTAGMAPRTTARYGTYGNDQRERSRFNK
ncbi:MAG: hypothetical protein EBQ96_02065 [Proteobacteria bacterium]|nr:hypothetical protein [Pseudomonadota bacterium]